MNGLGHVALDAQAFAESHTKLLTLKKATDDFEAGFVKQLVSVMTKSLHAGSKASGMGAETQQGLADDAYADALSKQFHLGLSGSMFDHLSTVVLDQAKKNILAKNPDSGSEATAEIPGPAVTNPSPTSTLGSPKLRTNPNTGAQ